MSVFFLFYFSMNGSSFLIFVISHFLFLPLFLISPFLFLPFYFSFLLFYFSLFISHFSFFISPCLFLIILFNFYSKMRNKINGPGRREKKKRETKYMDLDVEKQKQMRTKKNINNKKRNKWTWASRNKNMRNKKRRYSEEKWETKKMRNKKMDLDVEKADTWCSGTRRKKLWQEFCHVKAFASKKKKFEADASKKRVRSRCVQKKWALLNELHCQNKISKIVSFRTYWQYPLKCRPVSEVYSSPPIPTIPFEMPVSQSVSRSASHTLWNVSLLNFSAGRIHHCLISKTGRIHHCWTFLRKENNLPKFGKSTWLQIGRGKNPDLACKTFIFAVSFDFG